MKKAGYSRKTKDELIALLVDRDLRVETMSEQIEGLRREIQGWQNVQRTTSRNMQNASHRAMVAESLIGSGFIDLLSTCPKCGASIPKKEETP